MASFTITDHAPLAPESVKLKKNRKSMQCINQNWFKICVYLRGPSVSIFGEIGF